MALTLPARFGYVPNSFTILVGQLWGIAFCLAEPA
jgi:hypothetical protein